MGKCELPAGNGGSGQDQGKDGIAMDGKKETKMQELRRKAREQTEEDVAASYRKYRQERVFAEKGIGRRDGMQSNCESCTFV